jgi:hypothetical protein
MSSKPSSKSAARKSHSTPKAAKKKPNVARTSKPRPVPSTPRNLPAAAPTSPIELSAEALEFINAIDAYKRLRRRPFPNWSEVFEVVKSLGYHKSA